MRDELTAAIDWRLAGSICGRARREWIRVRDMSASDGADRYGRLIAHGVLVLARMLRDVESDPKRKAKMKLVVEEALEQYKSNWSDDAVDISDQWLRRLPQDLPGEQELTYLIDLLFVNPFSPNVLKYNQRDIDAALARFAQVLKIPVLDPSVNDGLIKALAEANDSDKPRVVSAWVVRTLRETQGSAAKAHRHLDKRKLVLFGAGGGIAVAATAGLAAPFIASAVGGAAGLAGAAALLHGMALLGGGSLAAGGLGMAGGFWILTGTGALVGATGVTAAAALISLGAEAAETELIKLQVSFAHIILPRSKKEAAEAIATVLEQRDQVRSSKDEALQRNEDDAPVLKELDRLERSLTDTASWMSSRLQGA
ncbi:hypothetical protein AYO39_00400 [Actinobacteria bacterium SCGC AG-212-D09]|nr:hypothetical protein AYO39_00400 [Actinobacteria bacterium SCGC AG-212-D09]